MGDTKQSYRPLVVFLGLVIVLAAFSYVLIFTAGNDDDRTGGFALLQFSPAISAIVTKLVYSGMCVVLDGDGVRLATKLPVGCFLWLSAWLGSAWSG